VPRSSAPISTGRCRERRRADARSSGTADAPRWLPRAIRGCERSSAGGACQADGLQAGRRVGNHRTPARQRSADVERLPPVVDCRGCACGLTSACCNVRTHIINSRDRPKSKFSFPKTYSCLNGRRLSWKFNCLISHSKRQGDTRASPAMAMKRQGRSRPWSGARKAAAIMSRKSGADGAGSPISLELTDLRSNSAASGGITGGYTILASGHRSTPMGAGRAGGRVVRTTEAMLISPRSSRRRSWSCRAGRSPGSRVVAPGYLPNPSSGQWQSALRSPLTVRGQLRIQPESLAVFPFHPGRPGAPARS
jgi:hypothetical protein